MTGSEVGEGSGVGEEVEVGSSAGCGGVGVELGSGVLAATGSWGRAVVGAAVGAAVVVGETAAKVGDGSGSVAGRGGAQAERTRTNKHAASKRWIVFNGKKFFLGLS
jgi:hypothetical protein